MVNDINDKHVHHRCSIYGSLPAPLFEKLMVFDGCYCGRAYNVENGPVVERIDNTLSGVFEVKHLKEQVCVYLLKDECQNEVLSRT